MFNAKRSIKSIVFAIAIVQKLIKWSISFVENKRTELWIFVVCAVYMYLLKTITKSEKDRNNEQFFYRNNNLAASFIREANSSTNLLGVDSSLSSDSNASSKKMCATK